MARAKDTVAREEGPEVGRLRVGDIHVSADRLRKIDDDSALVLKASIQERGQIQHIVVRRTPAAPRPYTLVVGGRRWRAISMIGEDEGINAVIVKADQDEALLIEIAENLFRDDLSVMDRAVFVQTYRDVWEKKYGPIDPKGGRPDQNRINLIQLAEGITGAAFSEHIADRMGISAPAVKRLNQIAQNIPPSLRDAVQGTPIADNQSQLLKLAKLEPELRRKAGAAIRKAGGDFRIAMAALTGPVEAPSPDAVALSRLIETWERASNSVRAQFRKHIDKVEAGK